MSAAEIYEVICQSEPKFCLNNFIHHKSGSNEYKNKQTNITKLTLSVRVYQQRHNGQPCIRMCLQSELSTELYEAKISFLIF